MDAIVSALDRAGVDALPVFCTSLRPLPVLPCVTPRGAGGPGGPEWLAAVRPAALLPGRRRAPPGSTSSISTLSFAAGSVGTAEECGLEQATEAEGAGARAWLARLGVPVLQALIGTDGRAAWSARAAGLRPLDVAMQVALPEFDGRLTTVPVAFKEESGSGHEGPVYVPDPERCAALARQAAAWALLRRTPAATAPDRCRPGQLPRQQRAHRQRRGPGHPGLPARPPARPARGRLQRLPHPPFGRCPDARPHRPWHL